MLTTIGAGAATGTLAGVADRMDLFPFVPRADLSIDRLSVNVTTAVASSLGKIVLYASNASGQPAGLLTETGTLDFSTTGVKEATVALTFRKGVTYWLGIGTTRPQRSAWVANATPDLTVNAPTTQQRKVLRRTVTFATAAPNPWTLRFIRNHERGRHRDLVAFGMSERELAGYVAELKAQIAFLSERAALLAAQLAEKSQEAELLRARIRANENVPGA